MERQFTELAGISTSNNKLCRIAMYQPRVKFDITGFIML